MNNNLCLDIGNVLGRLTMEPFVEELMKQTGKSEKECYFFLSYIQKVQDLGLHSLEDELRVQLGITSEDSIKKLLFAWDQTLFLDDDVLQYYGYLAKEYKLNIAIVSNIGIEHAKRFYKIFHQYDFLTYAIKHFSCDIGARKPTPLYYQMLLNLHPNFKGAIYLDDLEENLETGSLMGFKTLHLNLSELPTGSLELHHKLENLKDMIVNG